jgi:DNA (cytosine-5)-methyltransferase 1
MLESFEKKGANVIRPKAIDLFSGCGGLTLGLKQAGFDVVGAVEIDSLAIETYRMNHPEVHLWEKNICELQVTEVRKRLNIRKGELDLLAGCPPCQGFSSMRTLNGARKIYDKRNDLVFEFLRFVKELRPKAVMMENVPGLNNDERIEIFCREIEEIGYICNRDVLDAADYGVPQRRKRMILLAGKKKEIQFAPQVREKATVKNAIYHLSAPGQSGDPLHDIGEKRQQRIIELIELIPKDGGSRTDLDESRQLACHRSCNGFKDVYGRMAWNKVAPTITSGCFNPSKGRFLHPDQNRAITLREAAILQSFPQDYYFSLKRGKTNAALMIGNALPPLFIRHFGEAIINNIEMYK